MIRMIKVYQKLMNLVGKIKSYHAESKPETTLPINPEEKAFYVVCTWQVEATARVFAKTLEEAIIKVEEMDGLPPGGEYIDDTFEIDKSLTRKLNHLE